MNTRTGEVYCQYCGRWFDIDTAFATFDGDRARYRCPNCGGWTPGPPPA